MMDMLKIIDLAQRFTITKTEQEYEIESNDSNIAASIDEEGEIQYFVTGVYNSGSDWFDINIEALDELKELCHLVIDQEVKKS